MGNRQRAPVGQADEKRLKGLTVQHFSNACNVHEPTLYALLPASPPSRTPRGIEKRNRLHTPRIYRSGWEGKSGSLGFPEPG